MGTVTYKPKINGFRLFQVDSVLNFVVLELSLKLK